MPRFFFHLTNGMGYERDREGSDLSGAASAHACAVDNIRSIVAEEINRGVIDLNGFIEVCNNAGEKLAVVNFTEAFDLNIPGNDSAYGLPGG